MTAMTPAEAEICIIGSGPAALTLSTRLSESLARSTLVLDPSGSCLERWAERGERLGAAHLRTPVTVHPHANPLALQSYALKRERQQELVSVVPNFAPVPSWRLFSDFCQAKVLPKLPTQLARVVPEEVVGLEVLPDQGGLRLELSSGRTITARAVVHTAAPTQPVLPAWVRQLQLQRAEAPGGGSEGGAGCRGGAGLAGPTALPPQVLTWDQVDLRSAQLEARRVVVVGGGMAAATLAAGAAARGAQVTLVCRRPLKQQPFACEAGWWGNKQLHQFSQLADPVLRLKACWRAKQQGSIHAPLWEQLVQLQAAGRLTVVEGAEVGAASFCCPGAPGEAAAGAAAEGRWALTLEPSKAGAAVASGGSRARSSGEGGSEGDCPPPTAFQAAVAAAHAAAADALPGALPAPAPPAQQAQQEQHAQQQQQQQLEADAVWLACGSAYSCERDPVLAALQRQCPTQLVGSYPLLDDATLVWPGAPVFVIGRATMLSVGPCAGDLAGMRLAAERVAAALKQLDYPGEPAWAAAAARLAGLRLDPAALAALPLEEEGVAYEEPRPKPSVARPAHLVDVSDLDPALPRQELQQYKFVDDDFEITVVLQLPEAVPLDQVRTRFEERSLEMWAVGEAAAYRLYIPRLYSRVITKRCKAKVNTKARKIFLILHKESDAEWPFLKS